MRKALKLILFGKNSSATVSALGPDAPSLTWTSSPTDNTPNFDIGLPEGNGAPGDIVAGDVLVIEYSGDGGSTWTTYLTHSITSGDISSGTINESGVGPVADGSYLFRGHLTRTGSANSPNSSNVSVLIDTTGPTITTPTTASVPSLTTLAVALTATETPVTWSITGGVDAAQFGISGTTLEWSSNGVRDFASPADSNGDNVYVVQVTGEDIYGNPSNETISVTVTFVAVATRQVAHGTAYVDQTSNTRSYAISEGYLVEE